MVDLKLGMESCTKKNTVMSYVIKKIVHLIADYIYSLLEKENRTFTQGNNIAG